MEYLSPEKIAELCEDLDGIANIKAINKLFREQDESHLFPISGKFNATERAIRQARKFMAESGPVYGYEYTLLLDNCISNIVNDNNNW